jgi:hypothetical protein
LLEKLAALVPPPRFNLVRYHGVLAPAARQRARVVPSGRVSDPDGAPLRSGSGTRLVDAAGVRRGDQASTRPRNQPWAELMTAFADRRPANSIRSASSRPVPRQAASGRP